MCECDFIGINRENEREYFSSEKIEKVNEYALTEEKELYPLSEFLGE